MRHVKLDIEGENMATARIICGLGYGDEGKGHVVDAVCRKYGADLVVKYTGGPQASHTVVLSDGREHRFSQFGSGSFIPGCRTYIGRDVLVEPFAMVNEAADLHSKGVENVWDRLTVNPHCILITPWHWKANRIREIVRGAARHGSCGMGIGETRRLALDGVFIQAGFVWFKSGLLRVRDAVFASLDIPHGHPEAMEIYESMISEDIDALHHFYCQWADLARFGELPHHGDEVVFEGSQGVMLDQKHGIAPHRTWANTTFDNALEICSAAQLTPVKIGVLRTYYTRHGAGPFPTEDPRYNFPDHNISNKWQGSFRQGMFDLQAAMYAVRACGGVDQMAITHMDRIGDAWEVCKVCIGYERPLVVGSLPSMVTSSLSNFLQAPVTIESWGPDETNVIFKDTVCA